MPYKRVEITDALVTKVAYEGGGRYGGCVGEILSPGQRGENTRNAILLRTASNDLKDNV